MHAREAADNGDGDGGSPHGSMPLERLEAEITEFAGHLAAAECRWLLLVAEFDRRNGADAWGCRSTAHWLTWQCGLDLRAAREKVRVARALEDLPAIAAGFGAGELSYSKVRAMTRVATPDNEGALVTMAEHSTAVHVERIVQVYRGSCSEEEELEAANERHANRYLRVDPCPDGTYVVNGRIPGDLAAILLAALAAGRGLANASDPEDGPAGPLSAPDPSGLGGPFARVAVDPGPPTNADALVMMAETLLANGPSARTGGDRYQIVVNVDADVLAAIPQSGDADGGTCELDTGMPLVPETARRLACDASVVYMLRDGSGQPVDASSRSRSIPPALRRAVNARDHGCRFPTCGERGFVDVHHVKHWARGGKHELSNLVQLCWFHHRLVHEGGWDLRFDPSGEVRAIKPDGRVLASRQARSGPATRNGDGTDDDGIARGNRERGVKITKDTCIPRWHGDRLDLGDAIAALWQADQPPGRW